jgi:hypothetical protein
VLLGVLFSPGKILKMAINLQNIDSLKGEENKFYKPPSPTLYRRKSPPRKKNNEKFSVGLCFVGFFNFSSNEHAELSRGIRETFPGGGVIFYVDLPWKKNSRWGFYKEKSLAPIICIFRC